jgi:hypothetical protein
MFTVDDTRSYEILDVESNTSLTLVKPFQGASGNAQNYAIIRNWSATMTAELAARVSELVNKYEHFIDKNLEQIVGPKGDSGWTYKGTWASGRSYNAMDIVVYNDSLYIAILSHTSISANAPASSSLNWMSLGINALPADILAALTGNPALSGSNPVAGLLNSVTATLADPTKIFADPSPAEWGVRYAYAGPLDEGYDATPEEAQTPLWELEGNSGGQFYDVLTLGYGGRAVQIAVSVHHDVNTARTFIRTNHDAYWSAWVEVVTRPLQAPTWMTWIAINGATTLPAGGTWARFVISNGVAYADMLAGGSLAGIEGDIGFAWQIAK